MNATPPSRARAAGLAVGRWWRRWGPVVRRSTRPARAGWAGMAAYGWFAAYLWVGLVLSAAAAQVSPGPATASTVLAMGGGVVLGAWQARHRLRRHRVPGTPPLRRVGLALTAWVALLALAVWLQS